MKRARLITALWILAIIVSAAGTSRAQEQPRQERPRPAGRPAQETTQKPESEAVPETSEDALRRTLSALSDHMGSLTSEVKKLRLEMERSSLTLELLLNEERLARAEEKIEEALDSKFQLDLREQEIQRRMRNVQQEVLLRGGLRREEAENALRADLQRALEDVRNQQAAYQQRVSELQAQATRLRQRVDALRLRLDPEDGKKQ
jgi:chromosome segregation ATPase